MNKDKKELTTYITRLVDENFIKFEDKHKVLQIVREYAVKREALIAEEQKSLLEKITLEKPSIGYRDERLNAFNDGYNQAVDDLDQLKAHLTTGGGK